MVKNTLLRDYFPQCPRADLQSRKKRPVNSCESPTMLLEFFRCLSGARDKCAHLLDEGECPANGMTRPFNGSDVLVNKAVVTAC